MSVRKRLKKPLGDLPKRKKEPPQWVKDAADRAEARAKGEEQTEPKIPINPVIPSTPIVFIPPPPPRPRPERRRLAGSAGKINVTNPAVSKKAAVSKRLFESYDPEKYPKIATAMILNGATEDDLAVRFGVTRAIIRQWMVTHTEFATACMITREASLADAAVVRSLYQMATGYTVRAEKQFMYRGKIIRAKYDKHIPKDVAAAKFWLANRDPANWGRGTDGSGSSEVSPTSININMIRGMSTEQIRQTMSLLQGILSPNKTLSRLDALKDINNDDDDIIDAEVVEVKDGVQEKE